MLFYRFPYGTSRLMAVCAVAVFAVGGSFEYFRKIMTDFFLFHIECAEPFNAGSVDDISVSVYRKHFGEGRGMHSFIVVSGDCSGFCFYPRQYGIDKGGFADSGMSGKKGNPAFQHSFYFVYSVTVFGGNLEAGVADVGVQVNQGVQVMPFVPVININFTGIR